MSGNCVNIKSKEFQALHKQTDLTSFVLASKISLWQDKNGIENFPTLEDLGLGEDMSISPIKQGVQELFESNPELANSIYEALGFSSITIPNEKEVNIRLSKINDEHNLGNIKDLDGEPIYEFEQTILQNGLVNLTSNQWGHGATRTPYGKEGIEKLENILSKKDEFTGDFGPIAGTKLSETNKYANTWENGRFIITRNDDNFYSEDGSLNINGIEIILNRSFEPYGNYLANKYPNVIFKDAFGNKINSTLEITPQQKQQAQQQYSQYLESLNKPNTNPILQGNQQEQVKKFAELRERLNNKEFIEGAKFAYESSEGLQKNGTQEQYNNYIARVSLGIVKNPSSGEYNYESKVKDIVYHGTRTQDKFDKFDENKIGELDSGYFGRGFYFSPDLAYANGYSKLYNGHNIAAILNLQNPLETDANKANTNISLNNNDGAIVRVGEDLLGLNEVEQDSNEIGEIVVTKSEQIHILGSKQDIEGFKEFVGEFINSTSALKTSLGKELEYKDPYVPTGSLKNFKQYQVLDEKNNDIGNVVIEYRGDKTVILHPKLTISGKGYGKDLYKLISSKFNVDIQEWNEGAIANTNAAKKMWDSLEKEGVAERIVDEEQGDSFRILKYRKVISKQDIEEGDFSISPLADAGYSDLNSPLQKWLYNKRQMPFSPEKAKEIRQEIREKSLGIVLPNGVTNSFDVVRDNDGIPREILVYGNRGKIGEKSIQAVALDKLALLNKEFLHPSYYKGNGGATPVTMGYVENRGDHYAIVINPPFVVVNVTGTSVRRTSEVSKSNYIPLMENIFLTSLAYNGHITPEQYAKIYPNTEAHKNRYLSMEDIRLLLDNMTTEETAMKGENLLKYLDSVRDITVNQRETSQEEQNNLFEGDYSITPTVVANPVRLEAYTARRKQQIKKIGLQIEALNASQKVNRTKEQGARLSELITLSETLKTDLKRVSSGESPIEVVTAFFNRDFELLDSLLRNPSLDNIFLARDIMDFLKTNRESITENYKEAKENNIFITDTNLPDAINNLMAKIALEYNKYNTKLEATTVEIFMNLVDKYQDNLEKVFGTTDREEIKTKLLKQIEDIGFVSRFFRPQGSQLSGETDLLAQLVRNEYIIQQARSFSVVSPIIQKINLIVPELEKRMKEIGYTIGNAVNYQALFYRSTPKGDVELVSLFSPKWQNFIAKTIKTTNLLVREAYDAKDYQKVDTIYNAHYRTLINHGDFFDFTKLPEILASGVFSSTGPVSEMFNNSIDQNYRDFLIAELGETEYNKLIAKQIATLQNYEIEHATITNMFLKFKKVNSVDELLSQDKAELDFRLRRISPAITISTHLAGKGNTIPVLLSGTLGKASYGVKYTIVIPKRQNSEGKSTGFYDANFERIKSDPILYNAWSLFDKATDTINSNYADSFLHLDGRSMLFQARSVVEQMMDKTWYEKAKMLFQAKNFTNVKQFVKDAFSVKKKYGSEVDVVKVPGGATSIKSLIDTDYKNLKILLSTIMTQEQGVPKVTDSFVVNFNSLNAENQKKLLDALDLKSLEDLQDALGLGTGTAFQVFSLRDVLRHNVMERQTMNLPLLLKAQLEYSSSHKARTEAKKIVDNIYSPLQNFENGKRDMAKGKQKNFYDKTILNNKEEANGLLWKNADLLKDGGLSPKERFKKLSSKKYLRNLTTAEKRQMEIYLERLEQLDRLIPLMPTEESAEALQAEKDHIEGVARRMGKHYAISSIWNSMVNQSAVFIGMGLNPIVAGWNILQARKEIIMKAGEFLTVEATHKALDFIDMGWSRFMNPSYQNEWEKMASFVQALNVIQDGTNELQRAERLNKAVAPELFSKKNPLKFLTAPFKNPMFYTQYAEYYNQVTTILASAYNYTITDPKTGEKKPIFDGKGFPYHFVNDGVFTLKAEYATPENIADAESFNSDKAVLWKVALIRTILPERNGDYSESGVMEVKKTFLGKTLMLFKTWQSALFATTWQDRQIDLATGQIKGGFISDTLSSKRAMKYGLQAMMQSSAMGFLMGATSISIISGVTLGTVGAYVLPVAGLIIAGKTLGKIAFKSTDTNETSVMKSFSNMLKYFVKNNLGTMLELPFSMFANKAFVHTGIGKTDFGIDFTMGGELTEEEANSLRTFQRMAAMKTYTAMLYFLVLSALGGDDDDEENELKGNAKLREAQKKRRRENETKREFSMFFRNSLRRQATEIGFTENPINIFDQYSGKNASLGRVGQQYTGAVQLIVNQLFTDQETADLYMKPGFYFGRSKTEVVLRGFLPKPVANIGIDGYRGGLETMTQKVYDQNLLDQSTITDYKVDKKNAMNKRKVLRAEIWKELLDEKGYPNKNYLTPSEEKEFEKTVEKVLKEKMPLPNRKNYDDNQEKKEK